jgi:Ser/Thr protein kinase RdoA (MazF antagonist)
VFASQLDEIGLAAMLRRQGVDVSRIQRLSGGTLGLVYRLEVQGKPRVLKTHLLPDGRGTIEKEISLMFSLYQDRLDLVRLDFSQNGEKYIGLLMDEFTYPQPALLPPQVEDIIALYGERLNGLDDLLQPFEAENLGLLMNKAVDALHRLQVQRLISEPVYAEIQKQFLLLFGRLDHLPPKWCHGDLGPRNIMCSSDNAPVVIDWEDSFWGIEGYDYLYWLTFFDNRKYYSQQIFGLTPWGKNIELALLVMILVLKSDLSMLIDPTLPKALSFDARISEILVLK